MNQEIEIWKDVVGYEGLYEVSSLGQVRSVEAQTKTGRRRGSIIGGYTTKVGYRYVGLRRFRGPQKGYSVHRIVCKAFHANPLNKETVNHIDGDKSNNRADNLEWSTWTENNRHARRTGLNIPAKGERVPWTKLNAGDVIEIRKMARLGVKNKDLSERFNVSPAAIRLVVSGKNWKHVPMDL